MMLLCLLKRIILCDKHGRKFTMIFYPVIEEITGLLVGFHIA